MRSPNKPLELNILLSFDYFFVVLNDRLDFHNSVVVEALMEALAEFIVVSLRIEADNCTFGELPLLKRVHLDIFYHEKILEQFLEILFLNINVEIAKQAFSNIACLYYLLDCSSWAKQDVGIAEVMNYFIGKGQFLSDFSQNCLKADFYFFTFLFSAVDHYHCHFLVWLNEAIFFRLEADDGLSIIFPELLESWVGNTMEFYFHIALTFASSCGQLSKNLEVNFWTKAVWH